MDRSKIGGFLTGTILLACYAGTTGLLAGEAMAAASDDDFQLDLCFTYGPNGAERPATFIAGDTLTASVRLSGLEKGPDDQVNYVAQVRLLLKDGTPLMSFPEWPFHVELALGGNSILSHTVVKIPPDLSPGSYQLQALAHDKVTNRKVSRELPFEVVSATTFGALELRLCHDQEGVYPSGGIVVVGQCAYLVFLLNGYSVANNRVDVITSLTTLDETRTPTTSKPGIVHVDMEVPATPQPGSRHHSSINFRIPVTREGQFVFRLDLEDRQTGEKTSYDVPVMAAAAPKATSL